MYTYKHMYIHAHMDMYALTYTHKYRWTLGACQSRIWPKP